ncbi:methylmalonyl-CoA decarboxylase [Mesoterricola silvestris]|uniref:Methylmalonyl-CoA decarboxylase n=1 Tax=Mesoterricola silvestris TaxID=2927979 RepID=A0AA48KDJ2_9BACT|nr:methylmalonyl-CoA decarboxylase [Mesoterricola silvestris]BDU74513.1 methylmalonyl-CoA decarboxylase [Mesoterricola silvestris]
MDHVLTDLNGGIGVITLNNTARRNCLSEAMLNGIEQSIQRLVASGARAIILRAPKGSKVWSAGFDIRELPDPGIDPLGYNDDLATALRAVQNCPVPVIAMIEGSVWGGACDLAVTCDMAIGTPTTTFAITPAKLGVPYTTTGLMRFIGAMPMHIVKELFFTAQPISAERARELGLLNHLVDGEELEAFTLALVARILDNSPLAISVLKEQLRVLGNSYSMSPETQERIQGLRRMVYQSPDYGEGKAAFVEKRKPVFPSSQGAGQPGSAPQ